MSGNKQIGDAFAAIAVATEEFRANLQSIRDRITRVKAERDRISALPPDIEHIERRVDRWLQKRCLNDVTDLADQFLYPEDRYERRGEPDPYRRFQDLVLHYLATSIGDQVKAKCRDLLTTRESISEADREREIRRLDQEIAELENGEEQIIRRAESVGLIAPRRRDASPEALLAPDEDEAVEMSAEQRAHFEAVAGKENPHVH